MFNRFSMQEILTISAAGTASALTKGNIRLLFLGLTAIAVVMAVRSGAPNEAGDDQVGLDATATG